MHYHFEYKKLLHLAKKEYKKLNLKSHDWDHVQRVLNYCKEISKGEKANLDVLFPACILHDIGRRGKEKKHANLVNLSNKLLLKAGYKSNLRKEIISCIKSHSVESPKEPISLEEKILFDADKLDSYGVTGLARFFMLAGEQKWDLKESANNAFVRITRLNKITGFYTKKAEEIGLAKAKKAFIFYYLFFKEIGEKKKVKALEEILITKYGKLKGNLILKTIEKIFS